MNDQILPGIGFSLREILLGVLPEQQNGRPEMKNTETHPKSKITSTNIDIHMAFAEMQREEAYIGALEHAKKKKQAFDWKV